MKLLISVSTRLRQSTQRIRPRPRKYDRTGDHSTYATNKGLLNNYRRYLVSTLAFGLTHGFDRLADQFFNFRRSGDADGEGNPRA